MGTRYFYTTLRLTSKILLTVFIFASCNISKQLPVYEVRPMTAPKIIRKIETEKPVYRNYSSKKVSVNFENGESKNIFSGQLKIKRDECIIVSMRKMSVPLGKGKITTDSILFVNYFENYYMSEGIDKIINILGYPFDFNMIQSLLTGDISKIISQVMAGREMVSTIDSQLYRVENLLNPKISRALEANNERRIERYQKIYDDNEFLTLTLWVDPLYFVVKKMVLFNFKTNENIIINFSEHELIGRSLFPQSFVFEYLSDKNKATVEIKLSKSSVNKEKDFSFNIPDSYEKLNLVRFQ
ncbi:MAG: DUF4292 domain-containing protein [Prolixibacteraceae bacterium]|nr:DUF4292 domain-containing protein [Prolixibacteraceae bacterium]